MSIHVLFFGATADDVGFRSKRMIFSGEQNAAHLLERVTTDHPSLRRHKLLFSVNQVYVSGDAPLNDGDEVAIFTAVSGG